MLVLISTGQPVAIPYTDPQGNQYPPNLEQLWSASELAAIGLESVPNPAPIPAAQLWQLKAICDEQPTTLGFALPTWAQILAAVQAANNPVLSDFVAADGPEEIPANSATLAALAAALPTPLTAAQIATMVQAASQIMIP